MSQTFSRGKVVLVGAGPGDAGLLTLKAAETLKMSNVIVYDHLVNLELLNLARASAKRIYVGKKISSHTMPQQKINRLLASEAKKGNRVARLKGGDPYLFGRGGEEALYLKKKGVPFEVIPGVPSGTAALAYSGIPLTHRKLVSSVAFVTGHQAKNKAREPVSWNHLAKGIDLIVIYMGMERLAWIVDQLLRYGKKENTPAAVIEWGTWPCQKKVIGTLKNIVQKVSDQELKSPSLIVIGQTVKLAHQLDWLSEKPLFGKRIGVTRSLQSPGNLSQKLRLSGASVIEFPTIEITPPSSFQKLDRALSRLNRFDWLIFTSQNAVTAFYDRLTKQGKDSRSLHHLKIVVVGSATRDILRQHGVTPDYTPKHFQSASITQWLARHRKKVKGNRILVPRSDIAPIDFINELKRSGFKPTEVVAYKTRLYRRHDRLLIDALMTSKLDYLIFASSSAASNFVKIIGLQDALKCARRTSIISIGPSTSKTLKSWGLTVAGQAKIPTVDGLIKTLMRVSTL